MLAFNLAKLGLGYPQNLSVTRLEDAVSSWQMTDLSRLLLLLKVKSSWVHLSANAVSSTVRVSFWMIFSCCPIHPFFQAKNAPTHQQQTSSCNTQRVLHHTQKKAACCFLCLVFRFFCNPQRITDITNMQSGILLAQQNNHLSRLFIKSVPRQPKGHHISYQDVWYLGSAPGIEGQHAQYLGSRQRTSRPKSQVQLKGIRKLWKLQNCLKIGDPKKKIP